VAFLGGLTGNLYKQFALTLATSVILSAVAALTLTPALCALLLRPAAHEKPHGVVGRFFDWFNHVFASFTNRYTASVATLIRHAALVAVTFAVLLGALYGLLVTRPTGLVPDEDQGYMFALVQMPPGASLERTNAAVDQLTAIAEAQNIQAQLAEIGVTAEIETLELGVYVDRWLKADFDAAVALNGGNPDPHNMFFRYWHSTGNLNSVAAYSAPEIDELLQQGQALTDPAERKKIYDQVQILLAEAVPWVWLYVGNEYRVMQPYVMNYTSLSNGQTIYLRETWLDK